MTVLGRKQRREALDLVISLLPGWLRVGVYVRDCE